MIFSQKSDPMSHQEKAQANSSNRSTSIVLRFRAKEVKQFTFIKIQHFQVRNSQNFLTTDFHSHQHDASNVSALHMALQLSTLKFKKTWKLMGRESVCTTQTYLSNSSSGFWLPYANPQPCNLLGISLSFPNTANNCFYYRSQFRAPLARWRSHTPLAVIKIILTGHPYLFTKINPLFSNNYLYTDEQEESG